jgi:hypothetical protein
MIQHIDFQLVRGQIRLRMAKSPADLPVTTANLHPADCPAHHFLHK